MAAGLPADAADIEGRTPLHIAAGYGTPQAVAALARGGANLEAADEEGRRPLGWSLRNSGTGTLRALLDCGADPEGTDDQGCTAAHRAAYESSGEKLRLLVERGADLEHRDGVGDTVLLRIARDGPPTVLPLLLELGADGQATDAGGRTASDVLRARLGQVAARALLSRAPSRARAARRRSRDARAIPGRLPVHEAALAGDVHELSRLLREGVEADAPDSFGLTPLHLAAFRGHADCVRSLLAAGAVADRPTAACPPGRAEWLRGESGLPSALSSTALHEACLCGSAETVRSLVSAGADVRATDQTGRTPLHWLLAAGPPFAAEVLEAARVLIEAGADLGAKDARGHSVLRSAAKHWQPVALRAAVARAKGLDLGRANDGVR